MLYNEKWDKFSLPAFIAWLSTQSANKKYDWYDILHCPLADYLMFCGIERPAGAQLPNGTSGIGLDTLGKNWGYYEILRATPWTYGVALKRARAYANVNP